MSRWLPRSDLNTQPFGSEPNALSIVLRGSKWLPLMVTLHLLLVQSQVCKTSTPRGNKLVFPPRFQLGLIGPEPIVLCVTLREHGTLVPILTGNFRSVAECDIRFHHEGIENGGADRNLTCKTLRSSVFRTDGLDSAQQLHGGRLHIRNALPEGSNRVPADCADLDT